MKTLLILPPISLGTALTLYYHMISGIDITKGILLFISTLLFFFLCILFLVSHRESKHFTDSFFLATMLSGITIPICFVGFNYFINERTFVAVLVTCIFHIIMLLAGIQIVKKWYNYKVPYFGK